MPLPLALTIDRRRNEPVFLQIARALAEEIARGRLSLGDALPSTRELAASLRVNRNTVVAAYAELVSEGWAVAQRGDATRVASDVPKPVRVRPKWVAEGLAERPAYALRRAAAPAPPLRRVRFELLGGLPELRQLDVAPIARAYRRALSARNHEALRYGGPEGDPRLRAALAAWLRRDRGLVVSQDDLLVTRGSQMALSLAASVLVQPEDVVAVEVPGYSFAWEAFRARGASLAPVATDAHGLDVDALAAMVRTRPIRAVYITPHHQYPTTVTLSPARRIALLELARRERFAVLEDDYDHEFHFDGRPILPLASRDPHGSVIYVGTLAKILAPGLRIGFVVAPRPVLSAMAATRAHVDRQGDAVLERAVAELLDDGFVDRHVRKARRTYRGRRDALVDALSRELPEELEFDVPSGGLSLWARASADLDVEAWHERALADEVLFLPGSRFALDRPVSAMRLGYGSVDEAAIAEAVVRLRRTKPKARSGRRRAAVERAQVR